MDLYGHIDRERIQFDFLVHSEPDKTGKKCPTSDELMHVREPDYFDSRYSKTRWKYICSTRILWYQSVGIIEAHCIIFSKEHQGVWKVVQGHMTSTAAIYLPIARQHGIPIVCAHVRSGGTDPGIKGIMTDILRKPLQNEKTVDYPFYLYTGGREAGLWKCTYGWKVRVIPNAIDIERFAFQPEIRQKIRKELHLGRCDHHRACRKISLCQES